LAGLIEGDGSIIVPKTIRNPKGKLLYPSISSLRYFIEIKKKKYKLIIFGSLLNLYLVYLKTGKLIKRLKSTYSNPKGKGNLLHPFYVTGFVDGDGSFLVLALKRAQYKTGWNFIPVFTINLHSRDTALLQRIQSFLFFLEE
jgi:hypothetical protein